MNSVNDWAAKAAEQIVEEGKWNSKERVAAIIALHASDRAAPRVDPRA